ncbi:MAG: argininosuccinate synthase, partial [Leuconostoc sp.]|nr:argininosuccinate synthase [Leuconostoc sp.]
MTEKLVLAYSGGLDTSVAIPWLKGKGYEIIAVVLNVGQHGKDMDMIQAKALQVGASQSIVIDAQAEFADQYVAPVIKANMLYEGEYPMVSALSRPLIIKKLVDIAHENDAVAIAHG